MIVGSYAISGIVVLLIVGLSLLAAATWHQPVRVTKTSAWSNYRFGFSTYALIFLSFDMEMIFMYPWAVVFAEMGLKAFLDMFVFIAILATGIAYAWDSEAWSGNSVDLDRSFRRISRGGVADSHS